MVMKKIRVPLAPTGTSRLEEKIVALCNNWLKENGWQQFTVYVGGIPLFNGKKAPNPLKGFPDCMIFDEETGKLVCIEYKREVGGIVSSYQHTWHERLTRAGIPVWVINGLGLLKEKVNEFKSKVT